MRTPLLALTLATTTLLTSVPAQAIEQSTATTQFDAVGWRRRRAKR